MRNTTLNRGLKSLAFLLGISLVVGCGQTAEPSSSASQPTQFPRPNLRIGAWVAELSLTALTASSETIAPADVSSEPFVQPPSTPGTDRIAYVWTDDRVVGVFDIYTAKPDGSDPQPVTNSSALDTEPSWSPDSQSIAFVSTLDSPKPWDCTTGMVEFKCNFDIYTISATEAAATPKRLTTSDNFDRDPDWSPDGAQIVYSSREVGAPFSFIAVMNADGSGQQALTAPTEVTDLTPRWSPDGTKIAFTRANTKESQVWVMNADGSDPRQLLAEGALEGQTMRPDWSPDGTKIAMIQSKRGSSRGRIVIANADGSDPQVIPEARTILGYSPAWSPDNKRILYVAPYDEIPGFYNLGITDLEGQEINPMLMPPMALFSSPAWSLGTN